MRAMGIILTGGKNELLGELTETKSTAVLPIGGTYRVIDFSISNMKNSGIDKVAVITQYNSRSLREHLNSSRWWDFGRKHGGLRVFTPFLSRKNNCWYKGKIDAIYQNIEYLKNSNEAYVIIAPSESILKIDYNKVLEYHINCGADITVLAKKENSLSSNKYLYLAVNEDYKVVRAEKNKLESLRFMETVIISRRKLIDIIEKAIEDNENKSIQDLIINSYKKYKIMGYIFKEYSKEIYSLEDYYSCNMDFLDRKFRRMCFRELPYIKSKIEDEPPAKINTHSNVKNSICAGGCIINGEVKNSILHRRVYVGNNTIIKDSIILNDVTIGDNCVIENYIVDANTKIETGSKYMNAGLPVATLSTNRSYYL